MLNGVDGTCGTAWSPVEDINALQQFSICGSNASRDGIKNADRSSIPFRLYGQRVRLAAENGELAHPANDHSSIFKSVPADHS